MDEWTPYDAGVGAETYAAVGEDDPAWRQRQRQRFVSRLPGNRVADLGCGPGHDLAAFARHGLETIGVDGSAAMLRVARRISPRSQLLQQDLRVPLPRLVDGLWSMFSLVHLPPEDLPDCFASWRASLPLGGVLALALVESKLIETRLVTDWLGENGVECRFYYHRLPTIRQLLENSGFKVHDIYRETPDRYTGGIYSELELEVYVVFGEAVG